MRPSYLLESYFYLATHVPKSAYLIRARPLSRMTLNRQESSMTCFAICDYAQSIANNSFSMPLLPLDLSEVLLGDIYICVQQVKARSAYQGEGGFLRGSHNAIIF